MWKAGSILALIALWACAPSAYGDAVLDLVPDAAPPYAPGQAVTVELNVVSDEAETVYLHGAQFTFDNTDPTIGLPAAMDFVGVTPMYAAFPSLPVPALIYLGTEDIPDQMISFLPSIPTTLATVDVIVNDTGTLNVFPAMIGGGNWGWSSEDGTLTGGSLFMPVPEPATMALLALGTLAAIKRRRISPH